MDVYRKITQALSVNDLLQLSLVSKEGHRAAMECLMSMDIYHTIRNLYIDCPEKQAMEAVGLTMPAQRITAFLLAVKQHTLFELGCRMRPFTRFTEIILNRSFQSRPARTMVCARHQELDETLHGNRLLVAALLNREAHFEHLLQVKLSGDHSSNRLVFHLADRGYTRLLEMLQTAESRLSGEKVSWNAEPELLGQISQYRPLEFYRMRLLPGERLEVRRAGSLVMRLQPCSPIIASLRNGHRDAALLLAKHRSVVPTEAMIQLVEERGFIEVRDALIERLPLPFSASAGGR